MDRDGTLVLTTADQTYLAGYLLSRLLYLESLVPIGQSASDTVEAFYREALTWVQTSWEARYGHVCGNDLVTGEPGALDGDVRELVGLYMAYLVSNAGVAFLASRDLHGTIATWRASAEEKLEAIRTGRSRLTENEVQVPVLSQQPALLATDDATAAALGVYNLRRLW